MGEWQKTVGPDPRYPCTNCQSGSSSISSRIDPVTGELWSKSDGCSETCERLRAVNEPPDELLELADAHEEHQRIDSRRQFLPIDLRHVFRRAALLGVAGDEG
ncbi:hypothetical protein LCGC14_2756300, partial [marine sediment metagenome]